MEEYSTPYSRSMFNYWVMPKLQLKYLGLIWAMASVMVVLHIGIFYIFAMDPFNFYNLGAMTDAQKMEYYQSLTGSILFVLGISLFFTVVVSIFALMISHRVAGPIFKILHTLDRYHAGERKIRIHLRDGDEFKDISQSINSLIEADCQNRQLSEKHAG